MKRRETRFSAFGLFLIAAVGSLDPVVPASAEPIQQVLRLHRGWSLISFYVYLEETDAATLFQPLAERGTLKILRDQDGHFYFPEWDYNGIPQIYYSEGYQLYMNEDDTLVVTGEEIPFDTPIYLRGTWQLIPYYPAAAMTPEEALQSIRDPIRILKDGGGHFYMPSWDYNGIGLMSRGNGYQIKVDHECTLVYPRGE